MIKILYFLLIFPMLSVGQKISLTDIQYGMKHSVAEIEEHLIPKGFKQYEKLGLRNDQFYYSYINSAVEHGTTYYVWLNSEMKAGAIEVLFQNGNEYLALKKQVRAQGFQLDKAYMKDALPNEEFYMKGRTVIKFSSEENEVLGVIYKVFYAET